jgi:hypothetical protein
MFAHSRSGLVIPLVVAACAALECPERVLAEPRALAGDLFQVRRSVHSNAAVGSYVRGRVLDDATGAPIAEARVTIGGTALVAVTGADGRFQFEDVPMGEHVLHIVHVAYAAVPAELKVGHDALDVVVRLAPAAIALEPVRVRAFSRRLEDVGFYDRQRRGLGTFLGRTQIDGMRATTSMDLLRIVPAARATPQYPPRSQSGANLSGRGRCRYSYIVDGARTLPDFEIDLIAPYAIEGLEVYRSLAELPAPFRVHVSRDVTTTSCGIILIWTRDRS